MKMKIILPVLLIACLLGTPVLAADTGSDQLNSAAKLYSDSVDLANEGKYQQALDAADRALAMNVTSLTALIQSNRAGILVMLNRNTEAVAAADAALAIEGDLNTTRSIAYFNKGNALKNLGRIAEAREAYDHAYALDNTLVLPVMEDATPARTTAASPSMTVIPATATSPAQSPVTVPPTQKSPVMPGLAIGALATGAVLAMLVRR